MRPRAVAPGGDVPAELLLFDAADWPGAECACCAWARARVAYDRERGWPFGVTALLRGNRALRHGTLEGGRRCVPSCFGRDEV